MNYSIDWLHQQIATGKKIEYLFFWGHTQKTTGIIDKSCFSQWFPAPFTVEEKIYATAEHWMMAKKALLFNDDEQFQKILFSDGPEKVKECGRAVKNFDPVLWNKHAYDIVVQGNLHKFSTHENMKQFLISTGNAVIVEASATDKIWGIGTSNYETDVTKWNGTNLLGFALMEVRDILKKQK